MLSDWIVNFLGLPRILQQISSYEAGVSIDPETLIEALVSPIFPLFLLAEVGFLFVVCKRGTRDFLARHKLPTIIFTFNSIVGIFINLNVLGIIIHFFGKFAPFQLPNAWYLFPLGYVLWEFGHFCYHYSSHRIRLLWCFHATHHAAEEMSTAVIFNGFYFEYFLASIFRVGIPTLLGVPLSMLIFFTVMDGCWASIIHVSEELFPSGRIPVFDHFFLSPYRHRIHHAKNQEYLDKNFCNTLKLWDWVFGTLADLKPGVHPEYGIKGKSFQNSFIESYFSEFLDLGRDIANAKSLRHALQLMCMPPGWGKEPTEISSNMSAAIDR